jgi:hypothetical protein
VTPIASRNGVPRTPLTSVLALRAGEARFTITLDQTAGTQVQAIAADALPFTIGRSRGQTLVVDRRHAGVSGSHVVIDAVDDEGVHGSVEGDNGIVIDGDAHAAGARFAWRPGQTLVLGGALPGEPACTLALVRKSEG